MNQLETNLALWAICSIVLVELLFIICICRCCFNRIKPKRFYVKVISFFFLSMIQMNILKSDIEYQVTTWRDLLITIQGDWFIIHLECCFLMSIKSIDFIRVFFNKLNIFFRFAIIWSQNWIFYKEKCHIFTFFLYSEKNMNIFKVMMEYPHTFNRQFFVLHMQMN
jgi:hypothetical protein